ncbi:MAG TPA: hypothetical protein DDW52_14680 [Planctomycetaceae bacterium]|nr:hypothetical protein [Planctomycetaceae bacterium]
MKKLIVIDDDPLVLQAYSAAVSVLGHECQTFDCWKEAEPVITSQRPDAVFTDLNLGDDTGFDVLERIRLLFGPESPKVIAVSGESTDATQVADGGFDNYLRKPYSLTDLAKLLDDL